MNWWKRVYCWFVGHEDVRVIEEISPPMSVTHHDKGRRVTVNARITGSHVECFRCKRRA